MTQVKNNVIFIGDTHLKATSPVSRTDDYPSAILNKLEWIASISTAYNTKTLIILGDVFDTPATTLPYLSTVINTLKAIKNTGIEIYTLVGNHDIKNNRMDSLPSTALGILVATECLRLLPRELKIGDTLFRSFHYPEGVTPKASDDYEVCVAHLYYDFNMLSDSFSESDILRLQYDAMILGHYHVPCNDLTIGKTTIYRPGSLSRGTSELYNKTRTPRILLFNCDNHKAEYIDVECRQGSEIFANQSEKDVRAMASMKELIYSITNSYQTSDMDIRDYFNAMNIPYNCRKVLSNYLDRAGV